MVDLTDLLDKKMDDIPNPIIPEGIWQGVILNGDIYEETKEGEVPYSENREDHYIKISIFVKATESIDPADEKDCESFIESGINENTTGEFIHFIWGKTKEEDFHAFSRRLGNLGLEVEGLSPRQMVEQLYGAEIPVRFTVKHKEFNGMPQVNVSRLAPAE